MMKELKRILQSSDSKPSTLDLYMAIAKDAASELKADLVSIWHFDPQLTEIKCVYSFDVDGKRNLIGGVLLKKDFPQYFSAILENIHLFVNDVYSHRSTLELIEAYFIPNGVQSLLDYIIYKNNKPVAVICCETTTHKREWTQMDVDYIRRLTVASSMELS